MDHSQFADYAQKLADLVHHYVPATAIPPALPTAIVALTFGVAICVLGAKLARWFITILFAVGGLAAGMSISHRAGVSEPMSALFGALGLGAAGYYLHRFLVGLFTCAFLATVAFSVFSADRVLPHAIDYLQEKVNAAPEDDFHAGPSAAATAGTAPLNWDKLEGDLQNFRNDLMTKEPNLKQYGALVVLGAGILGLLMGIFLCRMTLILFTAALGTSFIGSGLAVLGSYLGINLYETCQTRPQMSLLAIASFFVVSVVLQTMLTRPEPAPAKAKAKES